MSDKGNTTSKALGSSISPRRSLDEISLPATAFTLSQAVPVNSAFVFYNGVCMKPTTDYGISGVTLTFTFTPLNNSNIMVRYQG